MQMLLYRARGVKGRFNEHRKFCESYIVAFKVTKSPPN